MIDAIVNAAVARIRELQGAAAELGHAIPRVDPLDGQINDMQVAELLRVTPAVFVAYQLSKPVADRDSMRWETKLNLVVVTNNLTSTPAAAALGTPGAPGAYLLAELLAIALSGDKLGLEIAALEPEEIRTLAPGWAARSKIALVGVQFSTAFWTPRSANRSTDALADFLRVQSQLALGGDSYTDLTETRS